MKFRLLIKQAVRDFKSKLQLYISFAIFLIVCLSIIVGLLGFFNSYGSIYNNVFNNGYTSNTHVPSFKFLDKNAMKEKNLSHWKEKYPKEHFLYDEGGKFEDFIMDTLSGKDKKTSYDWGHDLSESDVLELKDDVDNNQDNLINFIGINDGFAGWNEISAAYNAVNNKEYIPDPNDLRNYVFGSTKDSTKNGETLYNDIMNNDPKNISKLKYYAMIKLNRVTKASLDEMRSSDNYYGGYLLNKYVYENKIKNGDGQYKAGFNPGLDSWPGFKYHGTDDHLRISFMPQDDWMDDAAGSKTPDQFKTNDIANVWVKDHLSPSKISDDVLKNRSYAYVTPAFAHAHDIKLGDKIDASGWLQTPQGFPAHRVGTNEVTVIGEALSRDSYFTNKQSGVIFLPVQYLNELSPIDQLSSYDSPYVSKYYNPADLFGGLNIYDSRAGTDMQMAADDAINYLFGDFKGADAHEDIYGDSYNFLQPIGWSNQKQQEANVFLFKILCYVISAGVAILDIIVFWFICAESIKIQKKTLWFLKALGEYNWKISLLPTVGIMVPFLIASVLSIFGSLFVNNILSGAVGDSYGFYLPVWSFNVYSFVVLIIIIAISFIIFLALGYIQLSGGALSIHSDQKVGWIINLYMKTKPIYRKLPTDAQIGISFIVQNIMKNILTLVLLLISFAVVLFAMQFGSSARASAHSYENRNAPYKSLMLNKLNNIDAVQLNEGYVEKNIKLPDLAKEHLSEIGKKLSILFGEGYSTANISKSTSDEDKTAYDAFSNVNYPNVLATAKIDSTDKLKKAMQNSIRDIYDTLLSPTLDVTSNMKPWDAFYNKYLSQSYMRNYILSESWPANIISESLFNDNDNWVNPFIKRLLGQDGKGEADDKKILDNLHNAGIIDDKTYVEVSIMLATLNDEKNLEPMVNMVENSLTFAANNFTNTINDMRTTYNSAKSALNLKDIPLNLYFNKVLIPKDLDSAFITDLMYNGNMISGFGLDKRDSGTYNKIIDPLSVIPQMNIDDLDSNNNLVRYDYKDANGNNKSINVHHIDAYVSGNFATDYHISTGDIINLKATRLPLVESDASLRANKTYPDVYLKIDGIVKESSVYKEIYFNKIDFFNYLNESIKNDWSKNIDKSSIGIKAESAKLDQIIDDINSKDEDAKYVLNNSVFSKESIPYGFSHWTMNTKTALGYTLLDYVDLPIFNYSSDAYPLNYGNNLYIFSLITQSLMKTIQPIITTLDKFIAILLILAFVVALILINLVLWENRQTILLFKAIGYRKREIDGYLLTGYVVADCLGLIFGILVSYFGIEYASEYAFNMLHVSLFFVWSWQFIVTAIAMAVIFIVMIFAAVNWYTMRQKPKDAFNSL